MRKKELTIRNIKMKLRGMKKWAQIYSHFPQIWLFLIILVLSVICFFISINADADTTRSLFSNIFAGLITGLVISTLSGTKQIYILLQEKKLSWLMELHKKILDYLDMRYKFLIKDYQGLSRDDFIYDMGAHANWIKDYISQGVFDKKLSFNPVKYCQKTYQFDVISFGEQSEELHESLSLCEYNDDNSVFELFNPIHFALTNLNSKVCRDIREQEISIAAAQRSII